MDYGININASAASHVGMIKATNQNNFYVNGRFMQDYETDSVQVSLESSGNEFLFAVSSGMDREMPDVGTSLSIMRELKRFHDRIKNSSKDAQLKFDQLCDSVEETNNLTYSIQLGTGERDEKPAFTGLLISESSAFSVSIGKSRVYILRDGNIKQIASDGKKTERLLKMGIITHEQADMLSARYGAPDEKDRTELRKSDIKGLRTGDTFLLCSSGLSDMVDEERIYEILLEQRDTSQIANLLIKEALRNGGEDNITALVVRIERANAKQTTDTNGEKIKPFHYIRPQRKDSSKYMPAVSKRPRRISKMTRKIISTAVAFIIVAASIYGLYKLWISIGKDDITGDALLPPDTHQSGTQQQDGSQEPEQPDGNADQIPDSDGDPNNASEENQGTGKQVTYTVVKGDSLYQISRRFYNDPQKYKLIMEANDIEDPNFIKAGQVLIIPDVTDSGR